MANPVWPLTLPQDVLQGHTETPPVMIIRTDMDRGPAKQRRVRTAAPRPIDIAVELESRAQVTAFLDFFHDTLAGGALPFDWTHPRTLAATTFRFREANRSPPKPRHVGGETWQVDLALEIMP